MKSPTFHCPACNGTGHAKLPAHLAELLELFKGRTKLTASEVNATLKLDTANAVNMRLERLRTLGFLVRDDSARPFRYMKANPDEAKKVSKAAAVPKPAEKTVEAKAAKPKKAPGSKRGMIH